jgi:ATP-dependent helicase/nuclease subunit B
LLLALADAASQRFAPLPLLTLLKHPLVMPGDADGMARWRAPARPCAARTAPRARAGGDRSPSRRAEGATVPSGAGGERWWPTARALLAPLEAVFGAGAQPIPRCSSAALREAAQALGGDTLWSRAEGRAAATCSTTGARSRHGPRWPTPRALAPMLRTLMDEIAVRPPQGGHPRLAILGLIEARLQTADLMILGGLNEGVWPALPAPDPWLAPRIRAELGLPGLERRIGVSAHDLAGRSGRARRAADPRPPRRHRAYDRLALLAAARGALGRARPCARSGRLAPRDRRSRRACACRAARAIAADRGAPEAISVTEVDRLKADPYAFYARKHAASSAARSGRCRSQRGVARHGGA